MELDGALGNRGPASLSSSTLLGTRGAKGPSLVTVPGGAFEGSLSMSLILSPWRGGGSLPSSLLGGGGSSWRGPSVVTT